MTKLQVKLHCTLKGEEVYLAGAIYTGTIETLPKDIVHAMEDNNPDLLTVTEIPDLEAITKAEKKAEAKAKAEEEAKAKAEDEALAVGMKDSISDDQDENLNDEDTAIPTEVESSENTSEGESTPSKENAPKKRLRTRRKIQPKE